MDQKTEETGDGKSRGKVCETLDRPIMGGESLGTSIKNKVQFFLSIFHSLMVEGICFNVSLLSRIMLGNKRS